MHEISLVKSLLTQVDEIVKEHHAESAGEIIVEVGPLSGVEPALVKSAFGQLCRESERESAFLNVQEVPLVVICGNCRSESEIDDFAFRCRQCESGRVRIVRGDEFRLVSVSLNERPASV